MRDIKDSSGGREGETGGTPADNLTSDNDQANERGWGEETMHFFSGDADLNI